MPKNNSQCRKILQHMELFGSITAAEAVERYSCYRLSARIADLRAAGHAIVSEMVSKKNADGQCVNYAVYRLAEVMVC